MLRVAGLGEVFWHYLIYPFLILNHAEKVIQSCHPVETDDTSDESDAVLISESPTDDNAAIEYSCILPGAAATAGVSEINDHLRTTLQSHVPSALDALSPEPPCRLRPE
jgi:hypothetical protein